MMPIPAEYKAEYDRHKEAKGWRAMTGLQIVQAMVDGDIDHAKRLTERWKEENAECHRLREVEEAAIRRYKVFRAARKIGLVVSDART